MSLESAESARSRVIAWLLGTAVPEPFRNPKSPRDLVGLLASSREQYEAEAG
jgi:hypothetical protein